MSFSLWSGLTGLRNESAIKGRCTSPVATLRDLLVVCENCVGRSHVSWKDCNPLESDWKSAMGFKIISTRFLRMSHLRHICTTGLIRNACNVKFITTRHRYWPHVYTRSDAWPKWLCQFVSTMNSLSIGSSPRAVMQCMFLENRTPRTPGKTLQLRWSANCYINVKEFHFVLFRVNITSKSVLFRSMQGSMDGDRCQISQSIYNSHLARY